MGRPEDQSIESRQIRDKDHTRETMKQNLLPQENQNSHVLRESRLPEFVAESPLCKPDRITHVKQINR